MRIILDTSIGLYCHGQTQLLAVSLKSLRMIGTQ